MAQTTITVSFVNPPKAGKKKGSVKTTDDRIFGVWPDKLGLFQPGGTYVVDVEEREYQGTIYKTIKSIVSQSNGATAKVAPAATGRPAQSTAEEMFVMGFLNRCYEGTGSVPDRLTLTMAVRNLRGAWRDGFAANVDQHPEPGSFEEEEMV